MISPLFSLTGKTILVTGASSGIGRATSQLVSNLGASVICVGRNEERLDETLSLLTSSKEHQSIVADLLLDTDVEELAKQIQVLDGVVFCAGINQRCLISFFKESVYQRVLDTNLLSPIKLLTALLKNRKIKRGASLVFMASVEGNTTHTLSNSIYGVSKSGLESFVKASALELANREIRCNSILPGRIETPLVENNCIFSKEEIEKDKGNYPLRRYGKPEEVASVAAFLLSDSTKWITGTSIVIDGGLSLK